MTFLFGKKKQLYSSKNGQPVIGLPVGRKESVNMRRRNVADLGSVSAYQLLNTTHMDTCRRLIYVGTYEYAAPFASQFGREAKGITLIGTPETLKDSRFEEFFQDYSFPSLPNENSLPDGRGVLCTGWNDIPQFFDYFYKCEPHTFIILPDYNFTLSEELLRALERHKCLIIAPSLHNVTTAKYTVQDVLYRMEGIIVNGAGNSMPEITGLLKKYNATDVHTTVAMDLHKMPYITEPNKKGKQKRQVGFNWQQTRNTSERPVLSEGEIINLNQERRVICIDLYSPDRAVYVAGPILW